MIEQIYLDRAVVLLQNEFDEKELIVLKDPRISLLVPFWECVFRKVGYLPHYVVMVRNPLEVAASLRTRNAFAVAKSTFLWSSYLIAAERDTRDQSRTFVSYENLMNDWSTVRRRTKRVLRHHFRGMT